MHQAIKQMLQKYSSDSFDQYDQSLREILQEITLLGLWRGKFFEQAAFYGGTALRVFYGLDRFSEDLDFTLLTPKEQWKWSPYGAFIENELNSFGFDVSFIEKEKKTHTAIESAFLKTSTTQELLKIGIHPQYLKGVHPETTLRIKIEIDTQPTVHYKCEQKFLVQPVPVSIKCVNEESLFCCKMLAALFRGWKDRVKGRDWYDVVWFLRKKTPFNLAFFSELAQKHFTQDTFLALVTEKIDSLDIQKAVHDIIHFVKDQKAIQESWSKDFFKYWIEQIVFV